ncbi:MAG: phospholipid carrier-dependent glycosyltransferase [Flammeovirgaceae bacterium]|nr:phospholipid carrier-dependent glycosyltransferase [Flammeovirgaceae bacterium]
MKSGLFSWLNEYRYALCFSAIGLVYFFNLFIDVMEADAAQYAAISLEMFQTGNYLEVYHRGADYLDKPPLLFWLSALSFSLFGISNFAYKLPAVLIIILGIYSTYRFAKLWYDQQKAIYAALILSATQAFFLITNDVRTDGLLTGFVIFSLWQLSVFLRNKKMFHLIAGAVGVACAMMTKGPLGLVIVGLALGGDMLLKRDWKSIFKWEWVLFLVFVGLLLLPMCYGLYQQFDLHPEKEVYGLSGPSGLRFFFWTQSFGRITGELYWKDNTTFFYFFHTILWDFQPWILFMLPALWVKFRNLIQARFLISKETEWLTFSGFLLCFLALSTSGYKLPHYIFPLFPLLAIIVADFIVEQSKSASTFFNILAKVHFGLLHLFFLLTLISFIFFFTPSSLLLPTVTVILFVVFWFCWLRIGQVAEKIIIVSVIAMFSFGLTLSTYLYPTLLTYQAESVAAKDVYDKNLPDDVFKAYRSAGFGMDFYWRNVVPYSSIEEVRNFKKGTFVFTDPAGMEEITKAEKLNYRIVKQYDDFHVAKLSIKFLNRKTRDQIIQKKYLLEKM